MALNKKNTLKSINHFNYILYFLKKYVHEKGSKVDFTLADDKIVSKMQIFTQNLTIKYSKFKVSQISYVKLSFHEKFNNTTGVFYFLPAFYFRIL